jgi:mRNA deadenylase 3'-5' endonuclease subunit Ccr4
MDFLRKIFPKSASMRDVSSLSQQATTPSTVNSLGTSQMSWARNKNSYDASDNFTVASFNLLAPCYKRLAPEAGELGRRRREDGDADLWQSRVVKTIEFCRNEIYEGTDIVGFQEYWLDDQYNSLMLEGLKEHGFEVRHLRRTGKKQDAVAIAVKSDTFEILGSENVFLCALADRVALVLHLLHKPSGKTMLVANTHLSFPHSTFDRVNQMQQMKKLTNTMTQYAARHGIKHAARIVLGDFNVDSNSPVRTFSCLLFAAYCLPFVVYHLHETSCISLHRTAYLPLPTCIFMHLLVSH